MEILKTNRLTLRTWSINDLEDGFKLWGDPDVMRFIDFGEAETMEGVRISLQAGINHQEKYGHQHWAVVDNSSQKVVGACGFNRTDSAGELELVFHFAKEFWGKGFATEAANGCLEFAKRSLKPKKVVASCHHDNEASKHVLVKIGLSFVGNRWFEDTQRNEPCFELVT